MKKALLIGINKYPGCPLNGCINDIDNMAKYAYKSGFPINDMVILKDTDATTDRIKDEIQKFVASMAAGGVYLFHYSGHGSQMPTTDNEKDGLDECICPIDFDFTDAHAIRDNYFYEIFSKIPVGATLYWVSDSCHSGDLERSLDTKTKAYPLTGELANKILVKNKKGLFAKKETALDDIIYISGCKSNQTSADAYIDGKSGGALTCMLLKSLAENPKKTVENLVNDINSKLKKGGFSQRPQLYCPENLRNNYFLQ